MDTKRLRWKILSLAMRGKLVRQDPNDEPASALLEKILPVTVHDMRPHGILGSFIFAADDNRCYEKFADGSVKDISDEIPCMGSVLPSTYPGRRFELPDGWAWCRLGSVISIKCGDAIKVRENRAGIYPVYGGNGIRGHYFDFNIEIPTIIIGRVGFNCGAVHIAKSKSWITENAFITSFDRRIYTLGFLEKLLIFLKLKEYSSSTAQPVISGKTIYPIIVPLPPFAEQQRIAAEVERLFAQIDAIERNKLDLNRVIDQAKMKILDLAVRGKLVPQDINDEPAAVLLEKLRLSSAQTETERKTCITNGELKRGKNKSSIRKYATDNCYYEKLNEKKCNKVFTEGKQTEINRPFKIPDSWCWCSLNEICRIIAGQSPDGKFITDDRNGFEFHQGKICFGEKYLNKSDVFTLKITRIAPPNSILLCVRTPVGAVNIAQREICIGRGLCSIFPKYRIAADFWYYWLQYQKNSFKQQATGTTFKAISVNTVKKQLIPLPPLNEQVRIASKIEKLFELLNQIQNDMI